MIIVVLYWVMIGFLFGSIFAFTIAYFLLKSKVKEVDEYWGISVSQTHENWKAFYHQEYNKWQEETSRLIQEAEYEIDQKWRGKSPKPKTPIN